ncbi:alkaline phosphatase D family protein [Actinopolymorpha singaporensis]|uniref:Alkaline phosphatase D n=1 Tax=Actinopolymorpha singaporensis TaxID=117157 RepID=A0A1H1MHG2_9ACTN|nr:alkaline phosphatase D family protein [Actinopolymorpha singaporensis]SDR85399.1 alkaline phosphatase D [Actinopolymorpha singaporensis]
MSWSTHARTPNPSRWQLSRQLSRRRFLGFGGGGAAAVLLGTGVFVENSVSSLPLGGADPFSLGVASGDPAPDGVVLWTRLAPEPLAADGSGGMPPRRVRVEYEVAADERFRSVVRRGRVVATPELGHSVHPEVGGLEPDRVYYYRFRVGGTLSPVGRTRTTPPVSSSPRDLNFAFASCQTWQDGFFTAYDHLAREDLDLVVHLGDYIYEHVPDPDRRGEIAESSLRAEVFDLPGYRLQYALYKSEAPLRAAHASFPWVVTMDDHDVEDDWAGDHAGTTPVPSADPVAFRRRRAAAFQAMYENLPLRSAQVPSGSHVRLHRRLPYGRLVDLTMLDTRQYRDDQPCGGGISATCTERFAANRSILGARQRAWLLSGFATSPARWQVLGNQVPIGQGDLDPGPATKVSLDPWDGYVAERNRVLGAARDLGVRNLVVITGDRHRNQAQDLRADYADPDSPTIGSEFVGTSVTTRGDGEEVDARGRLMLASNPDLKFYNARRGYVRVHVDRQRWRTDFRVLPYVTRPGAPISTRATWVVEDRRPGVQEG